MPMTRYLVIRRECQSAYDEISRHLQFWNELRKNLAWNTKSALTRYQLFCNGDKK